MASQDAAARPIDIDAPLPAFSQCHAGILETLKAAEDLPALLEAAHRARSVTRELLEMFDQVVIPHHADEENELFPAVLRSAEPGPERERIQGMVAHLVREHRQVEKTWKRIEPSVRTAARGGDIFVDKDLLRELVQVYMTHARYEEQEFLPLAERILARDSNHMAALGIALHLRHVRIPVGYI
ncbi:hemerythrin domain-containing protein [Ramlibacter albus]|uniref:Hemerythrin domain-containing protein n=1 Tax=Ramlibacter albus TaxID=2079448 RepID=A0A923M5B9_9BURK|nr:hemerythrin domain-containing protein [Ramlibacter albus]MBC5764178.1 hemerythrin domain-containing protein [Ramlibacter albus]